MTEERKFRIHLRDVRMGNFEATATIQGDTIDELKQNIKDTVGQLELKAAGIPAPPKGNESSEQLDATVENTAKAFLANCEVHKTKWYDNTGEDGRHWRSHKARESGATVNDKGFCEFKRVADKAWHQELKNLDWDDEAVKAYFERHFPKATHFGALGEEDQARAIAILRIGKV